MLLNQCDVPKHAHGSYQAPVRLDGLNGETPE
jgi:hypothetical protein